MTVLVAAAGAGLAVWLVLPPAPRVRSGRDGWASVVPVRGVGQAVVVAVVASVVAFAFYLRIIVYMYMDDDDAEKIEVPTPVGWVLAVAVGSTLLWGILPGSLLDLAANALPL